MLENRKNKYLPLILIFLFAASVSVVVFYFRLTERREAKKVVGITTVKVQDKYQVKGIILPHHGIAGRLIAQSLSNLSQKRQYSIVVILAPNHFHPEKTIIATANTLEGIQVEEDHINRLTDNFPLITNSPPMLENEHAITLHLPYLKEYFPKAKIIPLIFSPSVAHRELDRLATFLVETLPPDTLYLLSLDFSHNSGPLEGLNKNEETLRVLRHFDYETLYKFGDEHLDSPKAAATFLLVMQKLNATKWETWHNTHSAILQDNPGLSGTSYLIGIFY